VEAVQIHVSGVGGVFGGLGSSGVEELGGLRDLGVGAPSGLSQGFGGMAYCCWWGGVAVSAACCIDQRLEAVQIHVSSVVGVF